MNNFGSLHEKDGRFVLVFERKYPFSPEKVFRYLTDPYYFTQWYPFATGVMNLRVGGKIKFDDGEGSIYEAVITELNPPYSFCFQEVDDLLEISLYETYQGCTLKFSHTFNDRAMAIYTAAGWHRCLEVLGQLIHDRTIEWEDNALELREYYKKSLFKN
ncbi:SRPBCC family protein [Anaerobacillus isosaccharinicus]|uniref:SRPBCC family protein n=1 Tax=Anaerobacillus isosaccharinicus TaxID=1532552 RepID=A0A1S2LIJ9_9BACI|nr:SRPBCC family protein [Anaerobacillus isosaccharinicus]MBA5588320.1 SRPBCC family protein [Anaerobacillus isosaccharinicus]QOY38244.1 SRPBCC family protein [Anaerobacillus isosaccharinicus]